MPSLYRSCKLNSLWYNYELKIKIIKFDKHKKLIIKIDLNYIVKAIFEKKEQVTFYVYFVKLWEAMVDCWNNSSSQVKHSHRRVRGDVGGEQHTRLPGQGVAVQ